MAATGYTPISLYYSTTASAAPVAGNLANGELAINITDGKLYYKDNTGTVKVIAGTGGTGVVAGSNTQIQFNNSGAFGASSNLTWNGSTLAVTGAVTATADSAFTSTGALQLPSGTTGQQPTGVAGKIRFNTTTGTFEGYNGTLWGAIGGAPTGAYTRTDVTATAGQTTFTGLSYQVGYIQVYLNGVLLDTTDYTASSGTSVVLSSAAAAGDIVSFVVLTISSIGNAANITGGAANQIPYQSGVSTTTFNSNFVFDGTNLGVGTSSPADKLNVSSGNIGLSGTTSTINFRNGSGTIIQQVQYSDSDGSLNIGGTSGGAYPLKFSTNGTERMRLDSSGNFMVGTTSPNGKFHVSGSGSGAYVTQTLENTNSGGYVQQLFRIGSGGGSGEAQIGYAPGLFFAIGPTANDTTSPIVFRNNNATERMRIDSSGNVGIGNTPSGTYKLEVSGLVSDTAGNLRSLPLNSQTSAYVAVATDNGKVISITTGGVTINNSVFSAGMVLTIYNNSGSSQTITQGTGVTLQWAGQSSSTTGSRTLGLYGIATVYFLSASSAVISGSGLT